MSKTTIEPQRHPAVRLDAVPVVNPTVLPKSEPTRAATSLPPGMFDGVAEAPLPLDAYSEVRVGGRNNYLIRVAGALRRDGLGGDELLEELLRVNEGRCRPPLDEGEVGGIAASAERWEPGPGSLDRDLDLPQGGSPLNRGDETEVALRVLAELPEPRVGHHRVLSVYDAEDGVYTDLDAEDLAAYATRFAGHPVRAGADRDGTPRFKPLKVSNSFAQGAAAIALRQHRNEDFFEHEVPGIAFANGFFGKDGIVPHSPEHRARMAMPFNHIPGAEPKAFIAFLLSCFRDQEDRDGLVRLVRQMIGVFAFGLATAYQKAFIALGRGANGKSVLLEVVRCSFTDTHGVTATPPQDWGGDYARARLANSRINIVSELPEVVIMASGSVKAMITGDFSEAREIYQKRRSFTPRAGHLFSANSLPGVHDHSVGFWRRWVIIPFERSFAPEEQDRGLTARLIKERASILSWAAEAVPGVIKAGGYDIPPSCDAATAQWQESADQIACFLADDEEMARGGWKFTATQVYNRFADWARESGYRYPVTNRVFWARLGQHSNVHAYHSNGRRMFKSLLPKRPC